MAKDDMHVIAYKILSYLYACLKSGKEPLKSVYGSNGTLFDIPESYWVVIMEKLAENGYIKGFKAMKTMEGMRIPIQCDLCITMAGVEYLQENSMMRKVAKTLKEAKDTIPFL